MKFYHGTTEANWNAIQLAGKIVPSTLDPRIDWNRKTTHFADGPDIARTHGEVVLEIEYDGDVIQVNGGHSQATIEEIPLSSVRRMNEDEVVTWTPKPRGFN